jgi:pyrimidine-nucleoside phosphorylase
VNPTEIIRKKRQGEKLSKSEIQFLVDGYLAGTIPEYQLSAFLMAVYFQKMDFEETTDLTEVMLHSGKIIDLSSIPGIKVDKHSTGGVGDKVSLILAPMVAACGVPVPMISGRGLGHTGGTIDKLESIPGFNTGLTLKEYVAVIKDIGVVMIGQTGEIAPADKRLYALRDVTATIESIPLIAGSIMSKKLAEGIDALVLDIKTGRGAFMQSEQDATELARTLIAVGTRSGKKTVGLITDMNQPLGYAIGNWLEVKECVECLRGGDVPDLMELTYALGGVMLFIGGRTSSIEAGIRLCQKSVRDGRAWKKFCDIVRRQGGKVTSIEHLEQYPSSKYTADVKCSSTGYVSSIDTLDLGFAGIMLGAGRMTVDEKIDPKAGIIIRKKLGDSVQAGDTLATLYTDREEIISQVSSRVEQSYTIAGNQSAVPPLIHSIIDTDGVRAWTVKGV